MSQRIAILERLDLLIERIASGKIATFARQTGMKDSTIRMWFSRNQEPPTAAIKTICQKTGTDPNWLLFGEEKSGKVGNLSDASGVNNKDHSSAIGSLIEGTWRQIPVLTYAQAGRGGFPVDQNEVGQGIETISCPPDVRDTGAYALRVEGVSMVPLFREGRHIIVSPNTPPEIGDPCVVRLRKDDEVLIKIWRQRESVAVLESVNPAFDPVIVPLKDIADGFPQKIVYQRF